MKDVDFIWFFLIFFAFFSGYIVGINNTSLDNQLVYNCENNDGNTCDLVERVYIIKTCTFCLNKTVVKKINDWIKLNECDVQSVTKVKYGKAVIMCK